MGKDISSAKRLRPAKGWGNTAQRAAWDELVASRAPDHFEGCARAHMESWCISVAALRGLTDVLNGLKRPHGKPAQIYWRQVLQHQATLNATSTKLRLNPDVRGKSTGKVRDGGAGVETAGHDWRSRTGAEGPGDRLQ